MKKLSLIIITAVIVNMLSFMSVSGAVTEEEKYLRGVWLSSVKNLDFPSKPGLSSE